MRKKTPKLCEHCGMTAPNSMSYTRWHGEKCRARQQDVVIEIPLPKTTVKEQLGRIKVLRYSEFVKRRRAGEIGSVP